MKKIVAKLVLAPIPREGGIQGNGKRANGSPRGISRNGLQAAQLRPKANARDANKASLKAARTLKRSQSLGRGMTKVRDPRWTMRGQRRPSPSRRLPQL